MDTSNAMGVRERSNFFLAICGQAVSLFGSQIYTFAIGLYVLRLTGSGQSFGITLMLGVLPSVLLGPFAGNWADRLNKKAIIVTADLVSAVVMVGIYFYAMANSLTLGMIYGATLVLSVTSTFLSSTFSSAAVDIVKQERLTRLNAATHSFASIIQLVSPIIGGIIFALVPISVFLLINGISFFMSAVSEVFIDFRFNAGEKAMKRTKSFFADLKGGFAYFMKDRIIRNIAFMALFLNFFLTAIAVVLPFGIVQVRGISDQIYGSMMAVVSLGSLGGSILIAKVNSRFSRRHLVMWLSSLAVAFAAVGLSLHSAIPGQWISIALISLFGFILSASATAINIPLGVFLQTTVDRSYLGRVMSILQTMAGGITPLAYLLFGALTERVSPSAILVASSVITMGIVVLQWRSRALADIPDHKQPEAA